MRGGRYSTSVTDVSWKACQSVRCVSNEQQPTVIAVLESDIFHGAEATHVWYGGTVDARGGRHVIVVGE
jgi:hypothetical protein